MNTTDDARQALFVLRREAFAPGGSRSGGSRRTRLWELDPSAHCPVVGVCLPLARLREIATRCRDDEVSTDDYVLHCEVVHASRQRSPLTEALQAELDRRYMISLRHSARLKTPEALVVWWNDGVAAHDIAGPLWAVLTHPRCGLTLRNHVLGDVHMLQHQVGTAERAGQRELADLRAALNAGAAEADALRERLARDSMLAAQRIARLEGQLMQSRADVVGRDSHIAGLRAQLIELDTASPGLRLRQALERDLAQERERGGDAQRALALARQEIARLRERALNAETRLAALAVAAEASDAPDAAGAPQGPSALADLGRRAVLCVGGRTAAVPLFRRLIEDRGGRFLHFDGGAEESAARLDSTLAAADLVICQTGCVSHDAYWRVKEHCKRTGKRCVFVDKPSRSGLLRALDALSQAAPA
jgi:hypothetical protein